MAKTCIDMYKDTPNVARHLQQVLTPSVIRSIIQKTLLARRQDTISIDRLCIFTGLRIPILVLVVWSFYAGG